MSRQCGSRVGGGAYACVPLGPGGRPVEDFLVCPPIKVDAEDMGLSAIGVKVLPRKREGQPCPHCAGSGTAFTNPLVVDEAWRVVGVKDGDEIKTVEEERRSCGFCLGTGTYHVWHVFDIVGAEYYPNVADFIEETRALGVSRRCELDASQYRLLDANSRLILLHPKAWIENAADYYMRMADAKFTYHSSEAKFFRCPQYKVEHAMGQMARAGKTWETCAGLYYHDLDPGTVTLVGESDPKDPSAVRSAWRRLVCGRDYQGFARHEEVTPDRSLAIFASFPLHHFEVVTDETEGVEGKLTKFDGCALAVEVCEE